MAIEYTWRIVELERNTADGGVVTAHWDLTGIDAETETSGRVYGSESFTPDATDPNFIAFDDLTEADVLAWIWGKEGFDKANMETAVAGQIEAANNPPITRGMPWSTSPLS